MYFSLFGTSQERLPPSLVLRVWHFVTDLFLTVMATVWGKSSTVLPSIVLESHGVRGAVVSFWLCFAQDMFQVGNQAEPSSDI